MDGNFTMTRRNGVAARIATATGLPLLLGISAATFAQSDCPAVNDVLLTNGTIHTMAVSAAERSAAPGDIVVESLRVVGDRVAATGTGRLGATSCTEILDLNGRTVIPGIIDNHNHIVLLGIRPGHDTRLEAASSINDALSILAARAAALTDGEWITAIGGYDLPQLVPGGTGRFPTLAELDSAVPDHPVFLQLSFAGPAATNSRGKTFFEAQGIEIGDDGSIAGGFAMPNPTTEALYSLRRLQTLADHKRGTLDAMRYAASLGITTHLDQGGFPATGTNADGAAHFDRYRAYDALLSLHQEDALINRIRLNFLHMETGFVQQARWSHCLPLLA
jgi:predicted amidohydrolase YtcJ